MKTKKVIIFLITLLFMTCLFSLFSNVKAATGSKYLNLKMLRNSGYGYQMGSSAKNIWKIWEKATNAEDTIYCLKGGPGFGSSDYMSGGSPVETHYTQYYNLKDLINIPAIYQTALPQNSNNYQALLWILDNCYVAPKATASALIKNQAKASRTALLTAALNSNTNTTGVSSIEEMELLTDDDIDAVQQLAVWYYTNPTGDYHVETVNFFLNAIKGTDANYKSITERDIFENGEERADAAQTLFDYLVKTPQATGFIYTTTPTTSAPIQIASTTRIFETVGNRYIIGPYKIEKLNDIPYLFEVSITDENENAISDVILLDKNKQQVSTGTTIKDLVGENFYISIPVTTNANTIKLNITGSYTVTKTNYWSVENPTQNDQPVVIIEKEYQTFEDSVSDNKPAEEKKFDLALRKFITSINGVAPTADRTPVISAEELTKLANGQTTANKVHPKNALTVKTGDKVVYKIRVYNEGEIDGYATEVTDYLPTGLKLAENSQINTTYGWTTTDGKKITTSYLADKMLNKFDGTTLDFKDLEIECEVIATVESNDQILKNIAEITAHNDKNGNNTVTDRDSQPNNVNTNNYGQQSQQDDDDFENLVLLGQYFDLSLRKFITQVKSGTKVKDYNRTPQVDTTPLKDGTGTTAIYNHNKTPVDVSNNDIVTYTIRVYNEGQIDGYVNEITDHLPAQLEFIIDDEINAKYGWTVSTDGRTIKTDITSPRTLNTANRDTIYTNRTNTDDKVLLKAYDGTTLDYIDVQIRCRVKDNINLYEKITNIADITDFTDKNGNTVVDRDSQKANVVLPTDATLPEYKDTEIELGNKYIKGQQDDDDFEKLIIRRFDLALRKFITGVNEKEITNRAPVFTVTENNEYEYVHSKEPLDVANGNIVIYTLRIFNEGNMDGYVEEIKDNLPEGLEYLPENSVNTAFKWKMYKEDGTETQNINEAKYVKTDYLSKEKDVDNKSLIKGFDPQTMTMPDYKDIKIAFKVTEPNTSDRIIINTAEITDDADENGDEVDDIDSTPDNNNPDEDDQDIEKIKVKYFDLSLKKWVTESIVIFDGKTTVTKTGHTGDENPEPPAKVEVRSDRINKTTVKFKFSIKITNEGEIAGYAKEVIDYIPEGLKFVAEDNPTWREEEGKVLTDQLKDVLIEPGESQTVEIILTWINGKDNMGVKTNWAEIYEDDNEYDSPDIDSTPGNDEKNEDDEDEAPVIISTATGSVQTYFILALSVASIITIGTVLIKKFVIE